MARPRRSTIDEFIDQYDSFAGSGRAGADRSGYAARSAAGSFEERRGGDGIQGETMSTALSGISLLGIESDLHDLFTWWQEADTPEEIEAAEVAIRACAEQEVRKVDGIRKYWRLCDQMEAAAKFEAETQRKRAQMWAARRDRLKLLVQDVMTAFHMKKLEGQTGSLYLKGNGGRQAVEISNPELVPSEYMRVTVDMRSDVWHEIEKSMGAQWIRENVGRTTVTPALSLIGEALEKDAVAGARLIERGQHVEMR